MPDTVAPTEADDDPWDGLSGNNDVIAGASISITFSEPMDPDTITTVTSGTTCSGTFQVSMYANFTDGSGTSSCVRMSVVSPVPSEGNKKFTVTPQLSMDKGQNYFVKIIHGNSGVKDKFGTNLSSVIEISFTTRSN